MKKMKIDKNVLLYKICIKVKQKLQLLYKIQCHSEDIYEELHIDLMGFITPTRQNGYKYFLTIIDSYSKCQLVENIYEKYETGLYVKPFVTFIEKQIRKGVKRLQLDQSQEFGVQDLESQTKQKGIKLELTVAYNPEINSIAERTNGLIASKAKCLLLDISSKIG